MLLSRPIKNHINILKKKPCGHHLHYWVSRLKKTISLVAWEHATKTNLFRILKHTYLKEFISKWIFQEE